MLFGAGTVLGEVAFYRGERRLASAIASTDATAWKLSRTRLADIERERPALSAAFHTRSRGHWRSDCRALTG